MAILTEIQEHKAAATAYDVFVSFMGKDTRLGFTDHLYHALINENITTFRDEEEIETGEELKPELQRAIKSSSASIIVISKNYASSTWCLDELVMILEQKRTSNHIVLPIFYHVKPTHVWKQESSFGDALTMHKERMEAEEDQEKKSQLARKLELWKKALTEVAELIGKDANGRPETLFIEEIVKEVNDRLGLHLQIKIPHLIGMDYSIRTISSWLRNRSSNTAGILTIWGIAGIGKTSLADYIYRLHHHEFERSSFLEEIERKCSKESSALLDLQKQLLRDLLKKRTIQVRDVNVGIDKIENALLERKTLVVLDGIDEFKQLDALIGRKGFHAGSKIIITTKDGSLTEQCALFTKSHPPKHKKHHLSVLRETEALRLLCWNAFGNNSPKEGYKEEAERVAKCCGGHPLSLILLGRSLINQEVDIWREKFEMLETKELNLNIHEALRISFNSLPTENSKELFKHIACFFVGEDREIIEATLSKCGIRTSYGISKLIDRCLLTIGECNDLKMHQLVQDMGRDLVIQESRTKPWKRSRLWNHEECLNLLIENKGTTKVQGLFFDMKILETQRLDGSKKVELRSNALENMENLKLLQLNHVKLKGSYMNFPKGLRWLCMHGFRMKYIPSELPMENLVTLDMSYSDLKQLWKNPMRLESLKFLNLSYCKFVKVGGFSKLPSLERLILTECGSLIQVCESIGGCDRLVLLDLSYCKRLKEIPSSIHKLKELKVLSLDSCIGVTDFTNLVPRSPKSFLLSLPASLVKLSLANNNLFDESFPMDFSSMSMLKELHLDGNPIHFLPDCVRTLSKLEILTVDGCLVLKSVLDPPSTLKWLDTTDCLSLEKITFHPEMSRLPYVHYKGAESIKEIKGIIKFQDLAQVDDEILGALGWKNLQSMKNQMVISSTQANTSKTRLPVQMWYEFGIFSTCYVGKDIPSWLAYKSNGPSISFTMPSSPMNKTIQGLNICFVHTPPRTRRNSFLLMKIRNLTKNHTWMYGRLTTVVVEAEEDVVWLSHWMFGKELEDGDEVSVTIYESELYGVVKECAINPIYIDRDIEEDPLSDYKLWKDRIGGDISDYQLTSGDYFLFYLRSLAPLVFHLWQNELTEILQDSVELEKFTGYFPSYKEVDATEFVVQPAHQTFSAQDNM